MALNEKLAEFLNDLGRHVQGEIRTDEYSKVLYSTDASIYQVRPLGVFFPKSEGEVQAAVAPCARSPRSEGREAALPARL